MKQMLFIISLLTSQAGFADISLARQNELLYFVKHDCGSCHGMTLKGGLGPALLPGTLSAKPKGFLVTTIMEGRENTAMPPWKSMLTRNEATWITEQLQQGSLLPGKNQQTELAHGNQNKSNQTMNKETRDKQ